jgi:hypothetical protein
MVDAWFAADEASHSDSAKEALLSAMVLRLYSAVERAIRSKVNLRWKVGDLLRRIKNPRAWKEETYLPACFFKIRRHPGVVIGITSLNHHRNALAHPRQPNERKKAYDWAEEFAKDFLNNLQRDLIRFFRIVFTA